MEPVDVVSDAEIVIRARNNREISENVVLKQPVCNCINFALEDTLMVWAFACRLICVQDGQSRGTSSESSKDLRSYMLKRESSE